MNTGSFRFRLMFVQIACLMICGITTRPVAADDRDGYAKAPPNHVLLSDTLNGWYFVPKELKEGYDGALRRLESLQVEVDTGQVKAKDAMAELADLKRRLKILRDSLESSRVFVVGAEIHEQTETTEFELGPEKRLAVTSNHIRVVGWDEPKVKVELKKLVLSPDQKPVDKELESISIVHKHELAEFAGQTDAQWEAQEAEFMANQGAKITPDQLANRKKLVDAIRNSRDHHRDLLGKEIDQITVTGLEYENNKVVPMKVMSDGGDGRFGSARQRYGELTVYVPRCTSVCIRGAMRGLQVEHLVASTVTVLDEDSTDSDAKGRFEVHGIQGNFVCKNFPLHIVSDVNGHVAIESTTDFGFEGAGTHHHDGIRDMTPARPFQVEVHDVSGGVNLRYGRVQLDLKNIGGLIDVENEFGDTHFVADASLADAAHRIFSLSGRIDAELSPTAWDSLPIVAVTNHGGIRTNVVREEFDEFNLTGQDEFSHVLRNWSGFRKVIEGEDRFAVFNLIDRFAAIQNDDARKCGLDLLTRNGSMVVTRK